MKEWGIYILMLFFSNTTSFSQTIEELLLATNSIYEKNKSELSFPNTQEYVDPFLSFSKFPETSSILHHQIELKKVEQKIHENNVGLQLKASTNYNLDVTPDEEININIRSSIRTELEWKVLKNGYVANRRKAFITQNEIFKLEEQKNTTDAELWRRQLKHKYIYAINEELNALLKQKQEFLNQYFDVVQALYQQKYVSRTTIINVGHQIHNNHKKIIGLKEYNKTLQDSSITSLQKLKLPLLQINTTVNAKYPIEVIKDLDLAKVTLQSHWLENINFSVYLNQNWISLQSQNRNFTSVGLRFSAPLFRTYRKKLIKKKQAVIKAQFLDRKIGKMNRWIVQFSDYQEKTKDLNEQYKKWKLLEEKLRVAQVLKKELATDEFGIKNLSRQLYQFEILENVLEIKKQLYKAIVALKVLVPNLSYAPFQFKSNQNTQKIIINNEYIYSFELQFSFLQAKGISKAYVTHSTEKLQKLSAEYQIEIEQTTSTSITSVTTWIDQELQSLKEK